MKKTKYFEKSANQSIQPEAYYLFELPQGSFISLDNYIDITRDAEGSIIKDCSGNRFKVWSDGLNPVIEPAKKVTTAKNLLQLNCSGHYWHFHHETIGQFLMYKELNVFNELNPENTAILVTWSKNINKFVEEAFKHIFKFNLFDYELIFAGKNELYTTNKKLFITTKTSTAGVLPLSYFSEKILNYLSFNENPTEYIYVGRDDSDCRLLLNQDEIIQFLNDNDIPIKKVTMTGMPYLQQVELFKNAKFVMAISGSGTTNQIYCNPNKAKFLFIAPKHGSLGCSVITAKQMGMSCDVLEGYENFVPDNKNRASDKTCANFRLKKEDVLEKVKSLL